MRSHTRVPCSACGKERTHTKVRRKQVAFYSRGMIVTHCPLSQCSQPGYVGQLSHTDRNRCPLVILFSCREFCCFFMILKSPLSSSIYAFIQSNLQSIDFLRWMPSRCRLRWAQVCGEDRYGVRAGWGGGTLLWGQVGVGAPCCLSAGWGEDRFGWHQVSSWSFLNQWT